MPGTPRAASTIETANDGMPQRICEFSLQIFDDLSDYDSGGLARFSGSRLFRERRVETR
jgi:hypothetical protein